MEVDIFLFWLTGAVLFSPLIVYKSFFLKMAILAYGYPVWLLSSYAYGLPVFGIMYFEGEVFYSDYYSYGFLIALSSYFAFLFAIWPVRNVEYSFFRLQVGFLARIILFLFFLLSVAIAYPASLGLSDVRFGQAGSLVIFFLGLLILTTPRARFDLVTVLLFFSLVFIVLRGERVDFILGLMILAVFCFDKSKFGLRFFAFFAFFGLLIAQISYTYRASQEVEILAILQVIPILITKFGTATDVVHVYMSSIWYVKNFDYNFLPLVNLIHSYLPIPGDRGVASSNNFVFILKEHIVNLGGGLFYIVGFMAFGALGAVLFGFLYGYVFKRLFLFRGIYSFLFITFFIMQFRIQWYGATYFGTVFLVSVLFFMFYFLLKEQGYARKRVV